MVFVKGPGLYTDIGKRARDLLYNDYQGDQKFTLTTSTANGVAITSSGTKKGDHFIADVNTQLKKENMTTDIKVDTNSNVIAIFASEVSYLFRAFEARTLPEVGISSDTNRTRLILADMLPTFVSEKVYTTITVDEPAPGVKAIFNFIAPDQRSGKVELQYLHEYAGISTSLGMTAKPLVNFSGVAGNQKAAFGTDISFDTATGNFTKYNAGVSFTTADLIASLALNDKGQTITASYFHTVSPLTNTAVGAELTHSFATNENTLTVGTQHLLDPLTSVKARVNNYGKASALIQHEWHPKSFVTISGEVDTRAIEKSAKVGFALALKP
ncbi:Voltage-dependent anion-selective channel protein 1 [Orobanche minor]